MKLILLTLLVGSAFCGYGSQKSGYEQAPDDGGDAVSSDGGDQQAYNNEPSHDAPKAGGTDDVDGVDTEPIKIKVGGVHTPDLPGIAPVKVPGPIVPKFEKPSYPSSNGGYKSNDASYGNKIKIPGSPTVDGIETPKIKVQVPGIETPDIPGSPDIKIPSPSVPVPTIDVKTSYPSGGHGNYPSGNQGYPSNNGGYKSNDAPTYPGPSYPGPGYIKTGGTDGVDGTDTDPIKIKVPGVHTPTIPGLPGVKVEQPIVPTFEKPNKYSDAKNYPSGYESANEGPAPPASATGGDQLGYSNEVRVKFRIH